MERDGLRVRLTPSKTTSDTRFVTRLVNRLVLRVLSGAIGLLSVGLMAIEAARRSPATPHCCPACGYFGLFCATVLAMRVIVAVFRRPPQLSHLQRTGVVRHGLSMSSDADWG